MSTPAHYRSGFTCRAVRMYASLASSENLAHLETCAACRDFFRAGAALETELRCDAARREAEAPRALEREILRAVRAAEPSPVTERNYLPWLAGAAALIAAIATVFVVRPGIGASRPGADRGDVAAVTEVADAAVAQFWNSVVPSVETVVEENPLPNELALVYADARRALDFLAQNFLPTPAAAGAAEGKPRGEG
jgi:hypothetical protein